MALHGLPIDRHQIVLRESGPVTPAAPRVLRAGQGPPCRISSGLVKRCSVRCICQLFHKNREAVDALVGELRARRPSLRLFVDRMELQPGAAWQQRIFESLDASRRDLRVFARLPHVQDLIEEFNIALLRHRESRQGVLLPLYLYTAELPTYMRLVQYEDVREPTRRSWHFR